MVDNEIFKKLTDAILNLKPDKPHPRHNLSKKRVDKLRKKQENKCSICLASPKEPLMVDHNHTTGKVRGLVCRKCNWLIGHIKEDIPLINRLLRHLDRGT